MAEVIRMPLLFETMTEGTIIKWIKKVGDKVSSDDNLADVETDKATFELAAETEGTLLYIGVRDGESAKVNSVLAIIGKEGTDISGLIGTNDAPSPEFKIAQPNASAIFQVPNYHIKEELGQGGMAVVFLAEHLLLQHQVAIKVLKSEWVRQDHVRKRFLSEARNMARMQSPHIVKVFDLVDNVDLVAFVMEYVDGRTLKTLLEERGRLDHASIKEYFSQMLDAVGYVHARGLVHRDLKPGNFMVTDAGNIKLLDFGIAKQTDIHSADYTQTETHYQMGTPMYMSPEQIKSTRDVTSQSDIYSLGVILWQMVMGKKPYDTQELSVFDLQTKIVNEKLPVTGTAFDPIIAAATSKGLDARYQDCAVFKQSMLKIPVSGDSVTSATVHTDAETTHFESVYETTGVDDQRENEPTIISNEPEVLLTVCKHVGGTNDWEHLKYGVINLKREWVVQPIYKQLFDFDDAGYCVAKLDEKWGAIDRNGNWLLQPIFDDLSPFDDEGYAIAEEHSNGFWSSKIKKGFINRKGNWIIPAKFDWLSTFDQLGNALANVDGKWGLIDRRGNWKLKPSFDGELVYLGSQQDHEASFGYKASMKNKTGIVNLHGEWIVRPYFDGMVSLNDPELCAAMLYGQWGIINRKGEWTIKATFDDIQPFDKDGHSAASYKGKYGLINRKGDWVLQPAYEMLHNFHVDGLYAAQQNEQYGLINKRGAWVLSPVYKMLYRVNDHLHRAIKNNKVGFINRAGDWVIEPEFYDPLWSF